MSRTFALRVLVTTLLLSTAASAADKWAALKTGMSRSEATTVLGAELTASRGRGFEVAIYDGKAEVVYLHGQVVAWTAPATSTAAASPADAWQFDQVARPRSKASAARPTEVRRGNGAILPAYRL